MCFSKTILYINLAFLTLLKLRAQNRTKLHNQLHTCIENSSSLQVGIQTLWPISNLRISQKCLFDMKEYPKYFVLEMSITNIFIIKKMLIFRFWEEKKQYIWDFVSEICSKHSIFFFFWDFVQTFSRFFKKFKIFDILFLRYFQKCSWFSKCSNIFTYSAQKNSVNCE